MHLQVLGYAAVMYSAQCGRAPIRHWGSGLSNNAMRIGNDRYRFSKLRHNNFDGIAITKDENHYRGGDQKSRVLWIPFEECGNLKVRTLGAVIS